MVFIIVWLADNTHVRVVILIIIIDGSLRDQIRNEEIRRKTRVTDVAQRVAKLKWQWRTDGRWGFKLEWNPAPVSAALVNPQLGGQTTSNESRGAIGYKRPKIVDFGTSYKTPM
ncbi:jg320 [Pararge aegeria aegeria]|uniref:Jg320 protein n=1 Tax=Pararge aegeria aegeria TaxID=348720 RepID=A0A8S4QFW6_9NEOP|nr:jg320 [Pararge aegeria aegeria]